MSGLPWYKRDPSAFIEGCVRGNLTLEEVGAYALLIDEMYRRGGPLVDDPRQGATYLRCDVRVWYRVRAALIRKGKIYATSGGLLSNSRVEEELRQQYDMREKRSRAARISRAKNDELSFTEAQLSCNSSVTEAELFETSEPIPLKNKGNAAANAQHLSGRYRVRDILPTGVVGSSEPTSLDEPVAKAMEAYNAAAKRAGWVSARLPIGAQRRRQVRARLKALGFDGWLELVREAEAQPFLGGSNDRGWRMDLEFFASEAGSTKILEGKYRKPNDKRTADVAQIRAEREAVYRDTGVWNDAEWGERPATPSKAQGSNP